MQGNQFNFSPILNTVLQSNAIKLQLSHILTGQMVGEEEGGSQFMPLNNCVKLS